MSYSYYFRQSPNYTPGSQTQSVWGRDRNITHIAIHHWGDPSSNPTFEGVVNVLCNPARQASAHYVAEAERVAQLVHEADNAWATNSANPYTIAIECNPKGRDSDFQTIGELIGDIWKRLGNKGLIRHKDIVATQCPGVYSEQLQRLVNIANTHIAPPPVLALSPPRIIYERFVNVKKMTVNRATQLWDFNHKGWEFPSVKLLNSGEAYDAVGQASHENGGVYYMTAYSFGNADTSGTPKFTRGVNRVDLTEAPAPVLAPTPAPVPGVPEWERNVINYEAPVILYAKRDGIRLYDVTTGISVVGVSPFPFGRVFDAIVRETTVRSQKYFISKYSADKSIWRGFKAEDLSLEAPVPPLPKPDDPTPDSVAGTDRVGALEKEVGWIKSLLIQIRDWITKTFGIKFN